MPSILGELAVRRRCPRPPGLLSEILGFWGDSRVSVPSATLAAPSITSYSRFCCGDACLAGFGVFLAGGEGPQRWAWQDRASIDATCAISHGGAGACSLCAAAFHVPTRRLQLCKPSPRNMRRKHPHNVRRLQPSKLLAQQQDMSRAHSSATRPPIATCTGVLHSTS